MSTEKLIDNPADLAAASGLTWPADSCNCCGGKIVDGRCLGAEKCEPRHGRRCAGLEATTEPAPSNADLRSEIKAALNRHSAENGSNTPDHVLADYLLACLAAFDSAVMRRSSWYGRHDVPGLPHAVIHTGASA